jgi:hypothetical protein
MDKPTTEDQLKHAKGGFEQNEFVSPKDSVVVKGITGDYIEYELKRIILDMDALRFRFNNLAKTLEDRRQDNLSVVGRLLKEKKPWVGLTKEDKESFWTADQMNQEEWDEFYQAVEAKLKAKNT